MILKFFSVFARNIYFLTHIQQTSLKFLLRECLPINFALDPPFYNRVITPWVLGEGKGKITSISSKCRAHTIL